MARIQTKRLVVFDLETTGTNPDRDCVIQVGAVALDGELSPCGDFELKLRFDDRRASQATFGHNSFEQQRWYKEAVSPGEAARRFAKFLHEHATLERTGSRGKPFLITQLASYNSSFDAVFLQAWFEGVREFLPADRRVLCLLQRTHWALVESHGCTFPENLKLGTVCRELGIPLGGNSHDAFHDARAAASLYRVLHGLEPIRFDERAIVATRAKDASQREHPPTWARTRSGRQGKRRARTAPRRARR